MIRFAAAAMALLSLATAAVPPSAHGQETVEPLAVGSSLPEFKVLDEHNARIPSSRLLGQVALIDLWATWCAPCRFTLPELQAIHDRYDDHGFSVIGISVDRGMGGGVRARKFAEGLGITYPLYHDASSPKAQEALRVQSVPQLFLIDAEGMVLGHWIGEPDFSEIEAAVTAALGIEGDADAAGARR